MKLKFYRSTRDGQWRWRVVAANGKKQANCGEFYKNFEDCRRNAERVVHPDIYERSTGEIESVRAKLVQPRKKVKV